MNTISQFNMVEQQIRPWNVHSTRLLDVIKELDRSIFVPDEKQALCFVDTSIALTSDCQMLEPKVAARLVQALDLLEDDRVLVVGAGSGYIATLCSKLAYSVDCVESDQGILDNASKNCESAGVGNIHFERVEDLNQFRFSAEYDAVLFRHSRPSAPDACFSHLSSTGRCVALVGDCCVMELMRYTQSGRKIKAESVTDILLNLNESNADHKAFVF